MLKLDKLDSLFFFLTVYNCEMMEKKCASLYKDISLYVYCRCGNIEAKMFSRPN